MKHWPENFHENLSTTDLPFLSSDAINDATSFLKTFPHQNEAY